MGNPSLRLDVVDGIGHLAFDVPGGKVNILTQAAVAEFEGVLDELEARTGLTGLLLKSGKPGTFIAGADLKELSDPNATPETTRRLVERGLAMIDRFERLPYPTVALIEGPCLGGGLELALAFDDRLLTNHPKTELGLPETKIGLIPGWGGTQRLARLIGPALACEMIATGESADAERARQIGLAFDVLAGDRLVDEGRRRLASLLGDNRYLDVRRRKRQPVGLSDDQLAFAIDAIRGRTLEKTRGHYPAPLAAIEAIERGCNRTLAEGLAVETERFLPLVGSPVSRNLIDLFFQSQRLAKDPGVADSSIRPEAVNRVAVVGAGLMGAGIAGAHVRRGIPTAMIDVSADAAARGSDAIAKEMRGRVDAGRMTLAEMVRSMSLLTATPSHSGLDDCDVIVEAIVEREEAKTTLYREIAPRLKPGTILASNTSTISIGRMAAAAPDPSRFAGLHFFNPVDRMALVEVIRGPQTSDATTATLVALVKRIGKTAIVVRDCPGFLVNRILFPYLNEAMALLEEGADPRAIDAAALDFGLPMGPVALSDAVGLDTCLYAGQVIAAAYPERAAKHRILGELVAAGRIGRKGGAGFFSYAKGSRGVEDPALAPFLAKFRSGDRPPRNEDILDRLLLPMVGEASRVVEEEIVRNPADVDMGLILGIGFPTFRGGLLRWAESVGCTEIRRRMERFAPLGARYEPTRWVRERSAAGR